MSTLDMAQLVLTPKQEALLDAYFPASDIEWRPDRAVKKGGERVTKGDLVAYVCVPYITIWAVENRLDQVFGKAGWVAEYETKDIVTPGGQTVQGVECTLWARISPGPRPITDSQSGQEGYRFTETLTVSRDDFPGTGEWAKKIDGAEIGAIESFKGAYSNALKRAARAWGIARYLSQLPRSIGYCYEAGKTAYLREPPQIPQEFLPA